MAGGTVGAVRSPRIGAAGLCPEVLLAGRGLVPVGADFRRLSPRSRAHVSRTEPGGGLIAVSPSEMVFGEVLNNKVG